LVVAEVGGFTGDELGDFVVVVRM